MQMLLFLSDYLSLYYTSLPASYIFPHPEQLHQFPTLRKPGGKYMSRMKIVTACEYAGSDYTLSPV